jgi:ParB-like chromosome segregation protein Spo0J
MARIKILKVVEKKVADLKYAPYNPRRISEEELGRLEQSMKKYGCADLIVWNERTGYVVGGNQRLIILNRNKVPAISVVVVNLSLEEEMALNVALNKISGDWDYTKLKDVLRSIEGTSLDVTLTGFSEGEVAAILQNMEFEVPEIPGEQDDLSPAHVGNFVIYLTFSSREKAVAYLREHFNHEFMKGRQTTIINMDEFSDKEAK